jgi:small subunit ribosomal protein S11
MYKKIRKIERDHFAIVYIKSSMNNTLITVTDNKGNTRVSGSSGSTGFSGARRKTSFAAQATAESVAKKCLDLGINHVEIRLRGFGQGRESSLRGLYIGGLIITKINDQTPRPHNGCRPPKKPRG